MTAEIRKLLFSLAAALAIIAIIAIGAACARAAHAQQVDESLPPLADLTIASEYDLTPGRSATRPYWLVTVKNNTVGANPGMHVALVKVEITISEVIESVEIVRSTSTMTIRDLPPGDSKSIEVASWRTIPAVSDGPAKAPQRLYAQIIESVPAESPRFGFNNSTEHWAVANRREVRIARQNRAGVNRYTNGDVGVEFTRISDRYPGRGATTTFTVDAYLPGLQDTRIPGLIVGGQEDVMFEVEVEISLSTGLSFAASQQAPSGTTFDASSGIWNVGTILSAGSAPRVVTLPVVVNLTAPSLADLSLEERCMTVKVVRAVPWFANDPLKRVNDTASACLGRSVVLSSGAMDLIDFYPCIGVTSYPCTSADTLELVVAVGDDKRIEQPDSFVVHVPDPDGRDLKDGSVIWSTDNIMDLRDSQTRLTTAWEAKESVKVTAPGGGDAPGRWLLTNTDDSVANNFDILDAMDSSTVTYEFFELTEFGNNPVDFFIDVKVDLWAMGTYEALYGISGRLSGSTYTDSGTYIFHVGPIADLEVMDAGANPEVAADQSAYTILAVNNGPDTAPAVRVELARVPEGAEAVPSYGEYVEGTCLSGLCEGVWTIGEMNPGYNYRPSVYGAEGAELTLISASGGSVTAEIKNMGNYCVRIQTADPDPENDRECAAGSVPTGYTEHSIAYYDHIEGNNTTMVTRRPGGLQGRHPGAATTTVAIHGAELALLSWSPVENLYGYPVTMYEIERTSRVGSPSWDEFEDANAMFHYTHSGGGGGNVAYRVRAVNEFGVPGPWSQVQTEEQTVRGPSAPGNLSATVDGVSVSLRWDAPTDNRGSAVTGYRIRYSENGDLETPITHATTTRMYEHTGLRQGKRYCYGVAAVNANGVGDFSDWDCATTEDAPDAPASLRTTAKGNSAVTLTWNAPAEDGGSAITGYRIDYSENGGAWQNQVRNSATTTREYEHTGLDAGTNYCYRVAAINAHVDANAIPDDQFSGQACATTETVPGAPRSLSAAAKGENAVTLNWRAPSSDGGSAVTGYRIDHSDDDGTNWETLVSNSATTTREYEHSSLATGSRHCYRVAAINTHGEGPLSGQACATTDGAPSAPRNLGATPVSETSIELSWDEPLDDGGEAVTGYRLEYYDGEKWLALESNLAPTTYTHTERDPGTNYCYRVAAINSNGRGPYSGQACATTTGSPDAPENLSAKADGKTSIILTWDKPTDTGGATIIGYRIDYQTDGGSEWITLEHDYDRTTYGHTGLRPGATYRYRVAATHDNGTGPFSAEVSATTEGAATDLPSEPENLRFTAVGRNHVTLKWDPPSVGGEVDYYQHRYDHDDETIARVSGGTRQATIGRLIEGQTHDFQVRAGNSLGVGEWSPPVQANLGGLAIAPSPLELDIKRAQGEYGTVSFRVRLNSSPKWPVSVGMHWEGDLCLTDSLPYQQFKILLPDNPPPSRKFWDDGYWGPPNDRSAALRGTGIEIEVDASRCNGGETAVVYLDISTVAFDYIAGASMWDDEAMNLDRADWEQKWGIPYEYQSGPSVRLRAVE